LLADVKQQATFLRRMELDFMLRRFVSLIAVTSITAGFAFDSLSVISIPDSLLACFGNTATNATSDDYLTEKCRTDDSYRGRVQSYYALYFVTASTALASGIFVITTSTFIVNWAQRLAVSGANSAACLKKSVQELQTFFPRAVIGSGISVVSILLAGFAIIWVKDNYMSEAHVWVATSFIFGIGIFGTGIHAYVLVTELQFSGFVHGDVQLANEYEASTSTKHHQNREVVNQLDDTDLAADASYNANQ